MIKLKSNQLSYKLFLALCILGSGIHVHGVESSTETSIVRPNSVKEADRMLVDAAWKGDVGLVDQLIQAGNPQVSQQAVDTAFRDAAFIKRKEVMN